MSIDTTPDASTGTSPGRVEVHPVTLARVVRSEWVKLTTLRSSWVTLAIAFVGIIGIAALAGWALASHWSHLDPAERLTFNPVDHSLRGVNLAQLAIGVLAVMVVSGEYATGMVRSTLAAVPTRLPVVWAKLVVFSVVTFVTMLVGSFLAFLAGQQTLASHGTTLAAPHAWRAIVGVAVYLALIGALAMGLAWIIRSTAGSIATLFGLLLVLPGLELLLPSTWQPHVIPYMPSSAGSAFYSVRPDPGSLSAGVGLLVLCLWVVASLVAGAVVLRRRDA
jgi:ABC-type transport system involved in multi-copper enzyme maturation permease subunit